VKAGSGTSWLVGITSIALVGGLIIYSYADWSGARYFGIADKMFWDYLELLIVPAALAFVVYWLNRTLESRQQEADDMQQARQRAVDDMQQARQRAVDDMQQARQQQAAEEQQRRMLESVTHQAQDAALRAYLDQMSQLLTDKVRPLQEAQPGDSVRIAARARTLTVLATFNAKLKRSVLQFLYEAGLINKEGPIVDLMGADLSGIDLDGANLSGADLSEVNLSGASLDNTRK
jgi:Tfp pilus assembly protein PilN